MKFNTILLALLLLSASWLTGCKDDDLSALEYRAEGYIKGKITGSTQVGNIALAEEFNYTQYAPSLYGVEVYPYYIVQDDGSIQVSIYRQDIDAGGLAGISFTLAENDLQTPVGPRFQINYSDERDNQLINFNMSSTNGNNTLNITNFSFDRASGRVKANFEVSGTSNSTDKAATITGEINAMVKEIVQ
jgi:hypothetical protein